MTKKEFIQTGYTKLFHFEYSVLDSLWGGKDIIFSNTIELGLKDVQVPVARKLVSVNQWLNF